MKWPHTWNDKSDGLSASNGDVAVYQAQRAHELELNKATAAFEHAIASALFLLNGGAAVAFLTLIGASVKEVSGKLSFVLGFAVIALMCRASALLLAAVGVYWGYRSQQHFARAVSIRRQRMEHARCLVRHHVLSPFCGRSAESLPRNYMSAAKPYRGIG